MENSIIEKIISIETRLAFIEEQINNNTVLKVKEDFKNQLNELMHLINSTTENRPHQCPLCKGKGCKSCKKGIVWKK